ncbi:hypothetical protein FK216_10025 [Moraxellaceae bacterium AER2_44_116]|nr:hypothetical protein [Moraxellaceae bacterium]TQC97223.1 hypothetical protein FK216_10025 [Moraxellaceae bacterium AER2_44_116]
MSIVCGKCSYTRTEHDHVPEWQCPSCGVAYNKIKKIQESARSSPVAASTAKKEVKVEEVNLETQDVVLGQKFVVYGVFLQFLSMFLIPVISIWMVTAALTLIGVILLIVGLTKVLSRVGSSTFSQVLHYIGVFLPLLNLIVYFSVNTKANTFLKHHGYEVGALGPRENFLNAPKFYGILFVALVLSVQAKNNKATNPIEVAKTLNAKLKTPVVMNENVRFDGISVVKDTSNGKDLLLYKFVLLKYEKGYLEWDMGKLLTDDGVKKDVCSIQSLHKNYTGHKEKYQLRANFYNKTQVLIKQVDIQLSECRSPF